MAPVLINTGGLFRVVDHEVEVEVAVPIEIGEGGPVAYGLRAESPLGSLVRETEVAGICNIHAILLCGRLMAANPFWTVAPMNQEPSMVTEGWDMDVPAALGSKYSIRIRVFPVPVRR